MRGVSRDNEQEDWRNFLHEGDAGKPWLATVLVFSWRCGVGLGTGMI